MKIINFILLSFIFFIASGQNSEYKTGLPSTDFEQIDSSNYINVLSQYMDTAFFNRYEFEIVDFEKEDSLNGIKKNEILFVGSSSFRKWLNMEKDLFPLPVLNRGFGGSTMPEADYYFFRIVKPYKPKAIVIYEGDNDVLAPFLTPEVILKSFDIFVQLINQNLPATKIFFVSIKPSPSRFQYLSKMKKTNTLIKKYCRKNKNLFYIDITKPMFDKNGRIREDIFGKDELHMNEIGYKIWAKIIKNELLKNL